MAPALPGHWRRPIEGNMHRPIEGNRHRPIEVNMHCPIEGQRRSVSRGILYLGYPYTLIHYRTRCVR